MTPALKVNFALAAVLATPLLLNQIETPVTLNGTYDGDFSAIQQGTVTLNLGLDDKGEPVSFTSNQESKVLYPNGQNDILFRTEEGTRYLVSADAPYTDDQENRFIGEGDNISVTFNASVLDRLLLDPLTVFLNSGKPYTYLDHYGSTPIKIEDFRSGAINVLKNDM